MLFFQKMHYKNSASNDRNRKLLLDSNSHNNTLLVTSFLKKYIVCIYLNVHAYAHSHTTYVISHVFVLLFL